MIVFICDTDLPFAYIGMMVTFLIYALISQISPFSWVEKRYLRLARRLDLEILFLSIPLMFLVTFWPALDMRLCNRPLSYWYLILMVGGGIFTLIVLSGAIEKRENQAISLFESIIGCFLGALLVVVIVNFNYLIIIIQMLMSFISPYQSVHSTEAFLSPEITNVELVEDRMQGSLIVYQQISFIDLDGDAQKVHYEILNSTSESVYVNDGDIKIPRDEQRLGSQITGTWDCGQDNYTVTLQVSISDEAGNKSLPMQYTIHCH